MNLTSCLLFSNIKCHCDASMMAYNYIEASGHSASAERFNQVDSIRAYFSAMSPFTLTSACTDPSVVFSWLFSISVRLADFPWMILFRSTFFRVWFSSQQDVVKHVYTRKPIVTSGKFSLPQLYPLQINPCDFLLFRLYLSAACPLQSN